MPAPRKVTDAQLEKLLTWMELHPQQAKNSQLGCAREKAASHKLWGELALRLNSLGSGTTKTLKEWRQYWNDIKCKVRKKRSLLLQHGRRIGGGPSASNILTPIEERILSLIGVLPIEGKHIEKSEESPKEKSQHMVERKHTGKSKESPMEKSQHIGPPQRALDLEERRLALDAERLEENRRFHRQQEKFQMELLSVFKEFVRAISHEPDSG